MLTAVIFIALWFHRVKAMKVLFQCNEGRAVRNKPAQFMAELEEVTAWLEDGTGFIIEPEPEPIPEPVEPDVVTETKVKSKTKKG
jgi:hypothetical protein